MLPGIGSHNFPGQPGKLAIQKLLQLGNQKVFHQITGIIRPVEWLKIAFYQANFKSLLKRVKKDHPGNENRKREF